MADIPPSMCATGLSTRRGRSSLPTPKTGLCWGRPWRTGSGAGEWTGLLFLSVLCTLFAFLVQMWAVRRTSPSRVSLLLGTEPLWAAAAGIALGRERLGALGLAGGALVLSGTAWRRRAAG